MILIVVCAILALILGLRTTEESRLEIEKRKRSELDERLTSGHHQFPKILSQIATQERIITLIMMRIYIINSWILLLLLVGFINLISHAYKV